VTFCSRRALEQHEPAAGTAVRGEAYVFLPVDKRFWREGELNTSWAQAADLQAIRAVRKAGVVVRLYDPPEDEPAPPVFVHTAPGRPAPAALAEILARFAGRWPTVAEPQPQIAICTHGTRDRCCAKWGFAAWREAERLRAAGASIFEPLQTSHLGGDRFAATGIVFPSGGMYASLDGGGLADLLAAEAGGRIAPAAYRGCVFEPQLQQIVRAGLAREGLFNDAAQPLQVERAEDDRWTARAQAGDVRFEVRLGEAELSFFGSCEDAARGRLSRGKRTICLQARRL
jgi:hypothetical protein